MVPLLWAAIRRAGATIVNHWLLEEGHYSPTQELYGSSTLLQPFIPGEQVPLPWLLPGKGGGGGEADQAWGHPRQYEAEAPLLSR